MNPRIEIGDLFVTRDGMLMLITGIETVSPKLGSLPPPLEWATFIVYPASGSAWEPYEDDDCVDALVDELDVGILERL